MLRRWVAPAVVGVIVMAGCGDDGGDPEPARAKAQSVGKRTAGSVVQFADCDDWNRGTRAQREATVLELRDQLTQQGERSNESPLSDRRAYAILQKACSPDYAGSLRLYKLYARAQGFAPLSE